MLNFLVLIVVLFIKENVFVLRKYALKYFEVKGQDTLQPNSQMAQRHNICTCTYACMHAYREEEGRGENKADEQTGKSE